MVGSIFKKALLEETGRSWEQWIAVMEQRVDHTWTHEQAVRFLTEECGMQPEWSELAASMFEQKLGRKPVGHSADAGFQIGVRRTFPISLEQAWHVLISEDGVSKWFGELPSYSLQAGQSIRSKDGVAGEVRVFKPYSHLRMSWQREEWDGSSTLQIRVLPASGGKTTISFHQEKLDDLYMRELMRRHWEHVLDLLSPSCKVSL
ncbi:SRPBCC family protein [Paenibacillus sp. MBLB4367]|uniref:SRPBCC family protein n=1 Tax=Paenibacillus sp. MBLB4367 TaxID=3384767 RepID=UPI003907FEF7